MKKILLLTALLVTSYNVFAFATQGVWRWRKDDGTETSATWKADQNIPVTIYSDSTIRLRIELYNNSSSGVDITDAFFEYTTDDPTSSSAQWIMISSDESNAFKFVGSSPFINDLT